MTYPEAAEVAKRIVALWPTVNPDQLDVTITALMRPNFTAVETRQVLDEVYFADSRFFLLSELVRRINELRPPKLAPNGYERSTAQQHAEDEERRRETRKMDETIGGMADSDLARLKGKVIAASGPWVAEQLRDRDPRTSAWLKALIYAESEAEPKNGGNS